MQEGCNNNYFKFRFSDDDLLLEYAVQHDDEAEAERIREELKRLTDSI